MPQENKKVNIWTKIIVSAMILCFIAMVIMWFRLESYMRAESKEPQINQTLITQKVSTISELCITELSFKEVLKFEKGSIPIINKNGFSMVYSAKVKLGFDLSKAEINVSGSQIKIKLPEPSIISSEIDEGSIEFYDEKNSLFNGSQKQDITQALQRAKEDVSEKAMSEENIYRAKQDAKEVIETILSPVDNSSDYSIDFIQ